MSTEPEILEIMREWIREVMRHSMHGFLHYTKESGLSMSQAGALFKIRRNGFCGVADVGEDLQVSSAAASQMLDRLVQQGFVERSENPEDRRGKRLSLTEKGQTFLNNGISARQRWIEELVNSLSPEEKEAATATIAVLVRKARALQGKAHHLSCHEEGASQS